MPSKLTMQVGLSRLMVATQQVQEKHDMKAIVRMAGLGWLTESSGDDLYQGLLVSKQISASRNRIINHTTESTAEDWPNLPDYLNWLNQTNPSQVSTNHLRVHATHNREHVCYNSFTLCRSCSRSPWVMIILASQIPIVQMSTLTHFWGVR
jgi:hypothetical protein